MLITQVKSLQVGQQTKLRRDNTMKRISAISSIPRNEDFQHGLGDMVAAKL